MKRTRRIKAAGILMLVFSLLFLFKGTVNASEEGKEPPSVVFTKTAKTLTAGKSFTFQVKSAGTEEKIVWKVSDSGIAKVNASGKLTGIRAGKIRLTAAAGEAKTSVEVTIKGKKLIAIDPGHQGKGNSGLEAIGPASKTKKPKVASGTVGAATKVPEYKLTLEVAKKLKQELLDRGYEVVMTRESHDVNITNKERAILANDSGADICVRIHADGASSQSVKGASTLYPSSKNPYIPKLSKKSKALSLAIVNHLCESTGARNRGVIPRDDLTGTNWSKIPVTVIEMGFMTNKEEDRLMQTKDYQNKLVMGIANGIDAYYAD